MKVLFLLFSLVLWASAQIYVQPGGTGTGTNQDPYGKIQDAVDNAANGSTIVLKDGTYLGTGNVNIVFRGRSLTIQSQNGYRNTFISTQGAFLRIFSMQTGENITLDGISLVNGGRSTIGIFGVSLQNIRNCYFGINTASGGGSAIYASTGGIAIVDNCIFENNANAAFYVVNGRATITNSRFIGNTPLAGDPGAGVKLAAATLGGTIVSISNSIFIDNGMAVYQDLYSTLTLTNNKFYNNTATYSIQCLNATSVTQSGNRFCGVNGNTLSCGAWAPISSPFDGCKVCYGFNENKDCSGVCWGNNTSNCVLQTINVYPGQQSIQSAIDSATSYRTNIVLHPGTYSGIGNYNINFNGKAVTVTSLYADPTDVELLCTPSNPAFQAVNGESYDTVIQGITITGCNTGGVLVRSGSGLTIKKSIIRNGFRTKGGAVYVEDSQVIIEDCAFTNNTAQTGGALALDQISVMSWGRITRTLFRNNTAILNGGALSLDVYSQLESDRNYYILNTAGPSSKGGAFYATLDTGSVVAISGSSFYNNGFSQTTQDVAFCSINNPSTVPFNVSNGNSFCTDTYSNVINCHNWTQALSPNADGCLVCNGVNATADCRGTCFGYASPDGFGGCCRMIERDCANSCARDHVMVPDSVTGLDVCCSNATAVQNLTGGIVCCPANRIDVCGVCGGNNQCCTPICENGGSCVAPNTCQCAGGWSGPGCTTNGVGCPQGCINGTCVGPYNCQCFDPLDESQNCGGSAPCGSISCANGGFCDNLVCNCSTAIGYTGNTCATPVCAPSCQNGGTCVLPDTCSCPAGRNGTRCESFFCEPVCQNGGTCTGPSTCNCPASYSGPRCTDFTPVDSRESSSSTLIVYLFALACLALFSL